MQHIRHLAPLGGLVAFMIGATPVLAQPAAGALPETTACPEAIASFATCYGVKHESGAYILAAMPKTWNGDLVVFAHGGPSLVPPTANGSKADLAKYAVAVQRGFGWVASSYRREGYGVAMAGQDSDNARRFFVERIAKPRHTYLHGASYGGLVGSKLIETAGKNADGTLAFDGAMFNSGAVGGATLNYQHRVDLRAVYQYVCKNLPRPDEAQYPLWMGVAADAKMTLKDLDAVVDECTGVSKPAAQRSEQQKKNLAEIIGVMGYPENLLVRHMQAATLLFRDIVQRTTGGRDPVRQYRRSLPGLVQRRGTQPQRRALHRRSRRRRHPQGRWRPDRQAADPGGVDPLHQRPPGAGGAAGRLSRYGRGRRQRRPAGAGLYRRARPHRPKPAGTRRHARCAGAMGREGHQADRAIDRSGLRAVPRHHRRAVPLAPGVHAQALRHQVLSARGGGAVDRGNSCRFFHCAAWICL